MSHEHIHKDQHVLIGTSVKFFFVKKFDKKCKILLLGTMVCK